MASTDFIKNETSKFKKNRKQRIQGGIGNTGLKSADLSGTGVNSKSNNNFLNDEVFKDKTLFKQTSGNGSTISRPTTLSPSENSKRIIDIATNQDPSRGALNSTLKDVSTSTFASDNKVPKSLGKLPSNFNPIDTNAPTQRVGVLGTTFVSGDNSKPSTFTVTNNPNANLTKLDIFNDGKLSSSGTVSKNVAESLGRGRGSFSVFSSSESKNNKDNTEQLLQDKLKEASKANNPFLIGLYSKRLAEMKNTNSLVQDRQDEAAFKREPKPLSFDQQRSNVKDIIDLREGDNDLIKSLVDTDDSGLFKYDIPTRTDALTRRFSGRKPQPFSLFKSVFSDVYSDINNGEAVSDNAFIDAMRKRGASPQLIELMIQSAQAQDTQQLGT
jgi:hypothetical protein